MYNKPRHIGKHDPEYASLTGYDQSLIRTLLLEREKRNLEARLLKIEKDRQKLINNFAQRKENTLFDLCARVRKRSTSLEELCKSEGEAESIKISRRESLNMIRRNNDRRIANAARWVFHRPYKQNDRRKLLKQNSKEESTEMVSKQTTKPNATKPRERRYAIQMRLSTPKSSNTEPLLPRINPFRIAGESFTRPFTWRSNTFERHLDLSKKVPLT